MTTRKQFLEKVKELGCTFEEDAYGDSQCITVDAPKGFVFVESGTHCLVEPFAHITFSFKEKAYTELIKQMNYGLEPCENPECDICNPLEERKC